MPQGMTDQCAQEIVAVFNDTWPPGSDVVLALDFGDRAQTKTAAPAIIWNDKLMVSLVGYGLYKLDRVIPVPPPTPTLPLPLTGPWTDEQLKAARDAKTTEGGWTEPIYQCPECQSTNALRDERDLVADAAAGNDTVKCWDCYVIFYVIEDTDLVISVADDKFQDDDYRRNKLKE